MTVVKVKFRSSTVTGRPGCIVYLVTRHRVSRQITTTYKIFPGEWDEKQSKIVPGSPDRIPSVQSVMRLVRQDLERLNWLISKYDRLSCDYSPADVVAEFRRIGKEGTLFAFMEEMIVQLRQSRHVGTADNYSAALNSFKRFRCDRDLLIEEMDGRLMEDYQAYLQSAGLVPNSISFHLRILRAVYNRAVSLELARDKRPFRSVFTGMEKTRKRAISLEELKRIKGLDLSSKPNLEFARDIFFFLFFCRGMSFVDAAFLKKSDVRGGVISYRRHKTGQLLHIRMVGPIMELVGRHTIQDSPYLLSIICQPGGDERRQYDSALRRVNNALKVVGELGGLSAPLTTYVSRHAWATIAKNKNVPIHVISEALGHVSVSTTQIYLDSIDASVIDWANEVVIGDL